MKKYFTLMVALVLIFAVTIPAFADANTSSEIKFDISPFENSDNYTIEFDDMDDTGEINLTTEGRYVVSLLGNDDSIFGGEFDIKIIENMPPTLRINWFYLGYVGEDWIFTDNVTIKTSNARYTFEVERDTDIIDGKICEYFTILFTDESIQMLQDVIDSNVSVDSLVKCRLNGSNRNVDCILFFDLDQLTELLADYRASGAIDNDFSIINEICPCKIKQL